MQPPICNPNSGRQIRRSTWIQEQLLRVGFGIYDENDDDPRTLNKMLVHMFLGGDRISKAAGMQQRFVLDVINDENTCFLTEDTNKPTWYG